MIPDDLYERIAIEATKALLQQISIDAIAQAGWDRFVGDVFDLTDALCAEFLKRLERNRTQV